MAEETYYELLQVSPTADLEIITAAYRALIRRHHPDRNPSPTWVVIHWADPTCFRATSGFNDVLQKANYHEFLCFNGYVYSPMTL